MLTLEGQLINIFVQPKGTTKDGNEYGGQHKVQIIGEMPLPDGGHKSDIYTLTAHNINLFKEHLNQKVSVPIGVMASRSSITYYIPKGSKPQAA